MNLLLDTHTFIWFDLSPDKLSAPARQALLSDDNTLFLSVVSLWEMQIKLQLGKLSLNEGLAATVDKQVSINQVQLLSLKPDHIYRLASLADHHRDPFDRLLIAQAITEDYHLVTGDQHIHRYRDPASVLW